MFWWKQCKFYPYFTAQKEKPDVLCKNHMISYGNVLVARLTLNKTFVFTKLASIDHFIELYSQCSKKEKTFYAVLIGDYRYLYLDIDFKVKFNMPLLKKTRLIKTIIAMLQRFNLSTFNTFCTRSKDSAYFIWDASRKEKFSVHLVNKHLIMHHKVMKQYVRSFRDWIKQKQVLPDNCEIDLNVYHTGYQLWRLPGNHNGNLNATLKYLRLTGQSFKTPDMSFHEQILLNFMINISRNTDNIRPINVVKQHATVPLERLNANSGTLSKKAVTKSINISPMMRSIFRNFNLKLQNVQQENRIISYRIKGHYCPIAKRNHRSNTGIIEFHERMHYIKYLCFDESCINKYQFYTLQSRLKRPWIFSKLPFLTNSSVKEIDLLIEELFKHSIISYIERKLEHQIIKDSANKIRRNHRDCIFSTYMHDNIKHTLCNKSSMSLSYRSENHKYAMYGQANVYCSSPQCCKYFTLNNMESWDS